MRLHFRKYGAGEPLVILHGLFGSSDNWHTLARRWGREFQVFALDQRNHGSSPHESAMNYEELAHDLYQFIGQEHLGPVHIVGHSMGGKVGMLFASTYPEMVMSLCILDIGIDRVEGKHETILQALSTINPDEFSSRDEIRLQLENTIKPPAVRQFLMKNILRRLDGSLAWKFNRDVLLEHYGDLTTGLNLLQSFSGSVLFLRGGNSDYLEASLSPEILHYFPFAQIQTIPDAGHWLHADQPKLLSSAILNFLK
ncbi:MAG: alpha/beta fold hydrolase [Candidatus Marinimicrobia bacterium]|nr:alpha/beta fold hydrolase [Candidatus Neomarinimicrobiota bacterium]MCF7921522.1 alpha/beta fold hydrolase [Candidatus Neomarinimicrobiota bacterium]